MRGETGKATQPEAGFYFVRKKKTFVVEGGVCADRTSLLPASFTRVVYGKMLFYQTIMAEVPALSISDSCTLVLPIVRWAGT